MVVRQWRGWATSEKANEYPEHFLAAVLPELRKIEGFRGTYLLRRQADHGVEYTVLTVWESMDAIRRFAGENPDLAVVAPGAQAALRGFDKTATHYEVVAEEIP
jgi:heme-degrading monooxygenase HmoA